MVWALLLGLMGQVADADLHRVYQVSELAFDATTDLGDPLDVPFYAVFDGPNGERLTVPGFWDGGRRWKIRFAPTASGEWSYRTSCPPFRTSPRRVAVETGVVRGGEDALPVDVDLAGADELRLVVTDGGDGIAWDHADWADAALVLQDGSRVWLEDLTPRAASQMHGELALGQNLEGQVMSIGGRAFEHGLGTSGGSSVIYDLPHNASRFEAWVGMDGIVGEHGTVEFRVVVVGPETIVDSDPGLDGLSGRFVAETPLGGNPLYEHGGLLRVSEDGNYLTYDDGTPFFWLADTWWFVPSDLMPMEGSSNPAIPSAFRHLIDTRVDQGFSAAIFGFLGVMAGKLPPQDFARVGELEVEFWQEADRHIEYATSRGLMPLVSLMAQHRVTELSIDDWRRIWRYVVARYGAYPVGWMVCAEYNLPDGVVPGAAEGYEERMRTNLEAAQAVREYDPYDRAMTIFPWIIPGDDRRAWDEPWYDFIAFQGGHSALSGSIFETVLAAYEGEPVDPGPYVSVDAEDYPAGGDRPVLLQETVFEDIQPRSMQEAGIPAHGADVVREAAYRAIQNGSFGFTYGAQGLWYPNQSAVDATSESDWGPARPWWEALMLPGAEDLGHLRDCYESVEWWRLDPRPGAATDTLDPTVTVIHDLMAMAERTTIGGGECKRGRPSGLSTAEQLEIIPPAQGETRIAFSEVRLPPVTEGQAISLVFAAGLADWVRFDDPQNPADGVVFAVEVDGREVWSREYLAAGTEYGCIDLAAWAGSSVSIVFRVGDNGNGLWDHARLRRPRVVRASTPDPLRVGYELPVEGAGVDVKAIDDDTFVLYYRSGVMPEHLVLTGAAAGGSYGARWHDPRTGHTSAREPVVDGADGVLPLPAPPDARDWVLVLTRQ